MDKKIFAYIPARLIKGANRWYILYYQINPETGKLKRFRETHNLNRIPDLKQRNRVGEKVIKEINKLLPTGYPFNDDSNPKNSPIFEALEFMINTKVIDLATESTRKYRALYKLMVQFIEARELQKMKIGKFSSLDAFQFMQWIWEERNIGNNTYNRFLRDAIIMFNLLVDYKYIADNPFKAVRKKRREEKTRRKFNEDEKRIVAKYIKDKDEWLFLAILLQYYCFIRPIELGRLRFSYFNLKNQTVTIPSFHTKNAKSRTVTIPDVIIKYFRNVKFASYPANYRVFGKDEVPGLDKIPEGNMRKRHKKYLRKLIKLNKLQNIDGLQWYSWKDTGITDSLKKVGPEYVRQQADHSKYETTLRYNHTDTVNLGMKKFDVELV